MGNKVIKISEKDLKQIVRESVKQILDDTQKQSARLDEMARIGFMGGNLEVYVWTDDAGKIPHVHVRDSNSQGMNFETCVRLDKPEYFLHGHYTDKMNHKQRKVFADFMRAKPIKAHFNTNYEFAVEMWNTNNSSTDVTEQYDANGNIIIPDYENLK